MRLSLADFSLLLLCLSGGVVVLFSVLSLWWKSRAGKRVTARQVVCRLCLHVYNAAGRDRVSACPQCGAENQR